MYAHVSVRRYQKSAKIGLEERANRGVRRSSQTWPRQIDLCGYVGRSRARLSRLALAAFIAPPRGSQHLTGGAARHGEASRGRHEAGRSNSSESDGVPRRGPPGSTSVATSTPPADVAACPRCLAAATANGASARPVPAHGPTRFWTPRWQPSTTQAAEAMAVLESLQASPRG